MMLQVEAFWWAGHGRRVWDSANTRRSFGGVARLGRHVSLVFALVVVVSCCGLLCLGLNEVASSQLL
jgi:hypothetical protein